MKAEMRPGGEDPPARSRGSAAIAASPPPAVPSSTHAAGASWPRRLQPEERLPVCVRAALLMFISLCSVGNFPFPHRQRRPRGRTGGAGAVPSLRAGGDGLGWARAAVPRHAAHRLACRKHMSPVKQIVKASITSLWRTNSRHPQPHALPSPIARSGARPGVRMLGSLPREMGWPHTAWRGAGGKYPGGKAGFWLCFVASP